jgi:hypothetical protein
MPVLLSVIRNEWAMKLYFFFLSKNFRIGQSHGVADKSGGAGG